MSMSKPICSPFASYKNVLHYPLQRLNVLLLMKGEKIVMDEEVT
jgi:hypothetical protein